MSASTRSENSRETDFFITDGAEHVLEEALELVLAFAIEKRDDAGDEGGADAVVVALCVAGEGIGLVETGDGGELSAGVGEAGGACLVVVVMERGRVREGAERGRGPEEGDRRGP